LLGEKRKRGGKDLQRKQQQQQSRMRKGRRGSVLPCTRPEAGSSSPAVVAVRLHPGVEHKGDVMQLGAALQLPPLALLRLYPPGGGNCAASLRVVLATLHEGALLVD
jgi:hypothetical protein